MKYTKMHGAGNDFIIINNIEEKIPEEKLPALARKLCAPHTSIGADGMMIVIPSKQDGDYGMLFFNNDGSLGEMCGNGARCICRYGYEHALAGDIQRVETTAGLVTGERIDARRYRIRLNDPSVIDRHVVEVDGFRFDCAYIELGDPGIPHAVCFLPDWYEWPRDTLREAARTIRHAACFPRGANVSFCSTVGYDEVKAITFERGVEDFTLACGTGCGSVVAILTLARIISGKDVLVHMPGGDLTVSVRREHKQIRDICLTGPTCIVSEGLVLDEDLEL